ncbi:MAG: hypothetical protein NUV96_00305 [Candidatus Colwellbacteria bacterium]|nr:hypothetical protein [Candidatus Colwellbacteria bacterium]
MKITDFDPGKAVTIFSTVKITREHPTQALTPVDLENHISQAVWKFYNDCRSEAADKLGKSEMDLAMTDVRVVGVKIDGHQVINPIGFTGRELEIKLCISMVGEGASENVGVEGGSIRAHMLSHEEDIDNGYYIEIDDNQSHIFSITNQRIAHLNSFDWGRLNIDKEAREKLDLDSEVAYLIYNQYADGKVSQKMDRFLGRMFWGSFGEFINALLMNVRNEGALKFKEVPPVYIRANFALPEQVFRKRYPLGKKNISLRRAPSRLDIEGFLEDGMHGMYEDLNELARRRIKWATPSR